MESISRNRQEDTRCIPVCLASLSVIQKSVICGTRYAEDVHVTLKHGETGLQEILDDPSIDAAVNVLPAHVSLQVFPSSVAGNGIHKTACKVSEKCWIAGKHVLQEKPIAISAEEARRALDTYRSSSHGLWQFAENYRHIP